MIRHQLPQTQMDPNLISDLEDHWDIIPEVASPHHRRDVGPQPPPDDSIALRPPAIPKAMGQSLFRLSGSVSRASAVRSRPQHVLADLFNNPSSLPQPEPFGPMRNWSEFGARQRASPLAVPIRSQYQPASFDPIGRLHMDGPPKSLPVPVSIPLQPQEFQQSKTTSTRKAPGESPQAALVRVAQASTSRIVQTLWNRFLELYKPLSQLLQDIDGSMHRDQHVAKILDNFAATTLAKYFQSLIQFATTCGSLQLDMTKLTPVELADTLIAIRLARSSDGVFLHCSSVVKSLRWAVRHLGIECLSCVHDSLISKMMQTKNPAQWKESLPLPLWVIVQWERKILTSSTDPLLRIVLGAFLFQCWSGLRWADMQLVKPSSLVFDWKDIRGIAWRTKTTSRGQPFACISSGFLSHGSHTWASSFLRSLDTIFFDQGCPEVDFLIPRVTCIDAELKLVTPLEPLGYADALFMLRKFINCPWRSTVPASFNSADYTIHGLKATLLSWSSQLVDIPEEWRRLQGHHRPSQPSVRLYSRDDTFGQLQLHRRLVDAVRKGFCPQQPLHRGGQAPALEPQIKLEAFTKEALMSPWGFFKQFDSPSLHSWVDEETLEFSDKHDPLPGEHDGQSGSSSSSSSSAHSVEQDRKPKPKQDMPMQDRPQASTIRFGRVRNVIHVVADWIVPLHAEPSELRSACGRSFKLGLKLEPESFDPQQHASEMCNHGGCRHVWSGF